MVYKNVNIWVGTTGFAQPKNIKTAVIRFKVSNTWLESSGIAANEIKMFRWEGSRWAALDTVVKEKDSMNTYFEAATQTFSPFAITGVKEAVKAAAAVTATEIAPAVTATPEITGAAQPGGAPPVSLALIIGVLAVIVIIVVLYLRRK